MLYRTLDATLLSGAALIKYENQDFKSAYYIIKKFC